MNHYRVLDLDNREKCVGIDAKGIEEACKALHHRIDLKSCAKEVMRKGSQLLSYLVLHQTIGQGGKAGAILVDTTEYSVMILSTLYSSLDIDPREGPRDRVTSDCLLSEFRNQGDRPSGVTLPRVVSCRIF